MLVQYFVTFVLWNSNQLQLVSSRLKLQLVSSNAVNETSPYSYSFGVVQSVAMTTSDIETAIYDAQDARKRHGDKITAIAQYMHGKFTARHGHLSNCFASLRAIRGTFYVSPYFVLLRSGMGDNLHIACFTTPFSDCSTEGRRKIVL